MTDSAVLAACPRFRQLGIHNDSALYKQDLYDSEPISRSPSDSGSSDSGVSPGFMASDTAMSSTSTELDSPSDGEADDDLDGVSTGIPSPFILSPRELDTPCTPLLARECGGRFPFPAMDQEDAGYESESDKKPYSYKHPTRPSAVRPRLHRAGSANWHPRLLQGQALEGGRSRSRSLLAPVNAPAVVTPPLQSPPSPTLVRAERPAKIDLPLRSLPKATAQAHLGRGLPSSSAVARRAVSETVPGAPRLCATPDEPRSPSPLDLPSPLSASRHSSSRARSNSAKGFLSPGSPLPSSPAPIPPKLLRRLAADNIHVKTTSHLPCTPRRVFQKQRSKLVPRDAPLRPAMGKQSDTPIAAAAGEHNPYFDGAIIVPGIGAMLDPSASPALFI